MNLRWCTRRIQSISSLLILGQNRLKIKLKISKIQGLILNKIKAKEIPIKFREIQIKTKEILIKTLKILIVIQITILMAIRGVGIPPLTDNNPINNKNNLKKERDLTSKKGNIS